MQEITMMVLMISNWTQVDSGVDVATTGQYW
jgi:hypothetical protein